MLAFLQRRVAAPLRAQLRQGVTPEQLSLSVAVGGIVGIFPVLGLSTLLCLVTAAVLRLNQIAIQSLALILTPVQLLLIIPFVRVGEHLLSAPRQPLTISEGLALIDASVIDAIQVLWQAILHAMLGWLAIGPLAMLLLYHLCRWIFVRLRYVSPARTGNNT